ncbi:tubby-like F-box protein 8 [Macadamia integrifolia]|uniref:tubby-like F-box protein 8 n=1 Tax=Macadamia integrifolia TaxID=60698 RepID=UPI001C4F7727|nr:tubby-like F-box protein 8 [Macadamia integrifolia]
MLIHVVIALHVLLLRALDETRKLQNDLFLIINHHSKSSGRATLIEHIIHTGRAILARDLLQVIKQIINTTTTGRASLAPDLILLIKHIINNTTGTATLARDLILLIKHIIINSATAINPARYLILVIQLLVIKHRIKCGGYRPCLAQDPPLVSQQQNEDFGWALLPPELLDNVFKRLEASESSWPSRKHVVACAGVCRSWREIMCKEIVKSPEFSANLTFPLSLKQPGPRDGTIQCFIKWDEANLTYNLFQCLGPDLHYENGKFLLSAKKTRQFPCSEYFISIERSSSTYTGRLRSNSGRKDFIIYDTQKPPYNNVSRENPTGNYSIARITYDPRDPRRMYCIIYSIPASALDDGGTVPGQPELLLSRSLEEEDLLGTITFPTSNIDQSSEESPPFILENCWDPFNHWNWECWCRHFCGRLTGSSVESFQLIAVATQPTPVGATTTAAPSDDDDLDHEKIILQFGEVGKDKYTMDYRYPVSAFLAFAICLTTLDTAKVPTVSIS